MRTLTYSFDGIVYHAYEESGGFRVVHVRTGEAIAKIERRTARYGSPLWHIVNGPVHNHTFATLKRAVEAIHQIVRKVEPQS